MISAETFARYAALRVPRYTSYPTAPNFSAAVGEAEYAQWLSGLESGAQISLYLHIPFCHEMCWYCGCHTTVTRRRAPVSRYVDSLIAEIRLVAAQLKTRLKVGHLHWGGGSPILLAPVDVENISQALAKAFQLDPLAESAVEVDPRMLTTAVAAAFSRAGVNRASLGVQTFDPAVQLAINRVQSFATTARAVEMLRDKCIPAINFDLVYGLPFQTVKSCLDTVEQALKLQPDRLAVFGYAHVPSFKPHQRKIDEGALPGAAERHDQANAMADALTAAGYRQIGLDHFALPGDSLALASDRGELHRNFQGYTTDTCDSLIGLGASAISKLRQGFVQNCTNIPDYQRRARQGVLPIARGCRISEEDTRRAAIIERLMCDYRADADIISAPALLELERDGLIRRDGSLIEVCAEARPLVRTVAAAFDSYLPQSTALHVTAV